MVGYDCQGQMFRCGGSTHCHGQMSKGGGIFTVMGHMSRTGGDMSSDTSVWLITMEAK